MRSEGQELARAFLVHALVALGELGDDTHERGVEHALDLHLAALLVIQLQHALQELQALQHHRRVLVVDRLLQHPCHDARSLGHVALRCHLCVPRASHRSPTPPSTPHARPNGRGTAGCGTGRRMKHDRMKHHRRIKHHPSCVVLVPHKPPCTRHQGDGAQGGSGHTRQRRMQRMAHATRSSRHALTKARARHAREGQVTPVSESPPGPRTGAANSWTAPAVPRSRLPTHTHTHTHTHIHAHTHTHTHTT